MVSGDGMPVDVADRARAAGRPAAISWSGGKDAWLAWRRATEAGLDVRSFLTMCDAGGESLAHGLPGDWIAAQVAAAGGVSRRVRVPPGAYADRFDAALARLRDEGHGAVVFGDIDLAAHRDWIAPRVSAAGLVPVFPLWGEPRRALAHELVARGVQARVVCVDLGRVPRSFLGRAYDRGFVDDLPAGVCPVGEDGEFHTLVTGGPGFAGGAALEWVAGPVREVASRPPWPPSRHAFQRPAGTPPWIAGASGAAAATAADAWPERAA